MPYSKWEKNHCWTKINREAKRKNLKVEVMYYGEEQKTIQGQMLC